MDYKNKYLKYKEKYLNLKNQTGSGILYDKITDDDCSPPQKIRIIQNHKSNKIVILLGEAHESIEASTIKLDKGGTILRRQDPKKGYDKYLGLITKKISLAKQNIGGRHKFDPFQKVLFLTEIPPPIISLGGGKKELSDTLFSSNDEKIWKLNYINQRINQMKPKYYPNVLYRPIDIRHLLEIQYVMPSYIDQMYEKLKDKSDDEINNIIQHYIDYGFTNIQKYIKNNKIFEQSSAISYFQKVYPDLDSINKKDFGDNFDKLNQRSKIDSPKKLNDIFINTRVEYNYLKEILVNKIKIINEKDGLKIFTNEKFKEFTIKQKLDIYYELCKDLDSLIARIMDFYGLEYIYEMPDNSTTVIIGGAAHTDFIFSRLCIIDDYNLIESEKPFSSEDDLSDCKIYFPITSPREIGEFNDIIKRVRERLLIASPIEKSNFFNNLILQKTRLFKKTSKDPYHTLITTYGYFYTLLKINVNIVFEEII